MVKSFGMLDYLVVIGYLVAIATIGSMFYAEKTRQRTTFLLAGRCPGCPWAFPFSLPILVRSP
jgi:Na+/proline symporter